MVVLRSDSRVRTWLGEQLFDKLALKCHSERQYMLLDYLEQKHDS